MFGKCTSMLNFPVLQNWEVAPFWCKTYLELAPDLAQKPVQIREILHQYLHQSWCKFSSSEPQNDRFFSKKSFKWGDFGWQRGAMFCSSARNAARRKKRRGAVFWIRRCCGQEEKKQSPTQGRAPKIRKKYRKDYQNGPKSDTSRISLVFLFVFLGPDPSWVGDFVFFFVIFSYSRGSGGLPGKRAHKPGSHGSPPWSASCSHIWDIYLSRRPQSGGHLRGGRQKIGLRLRPETPLAEVPPNQRHLKNSENALFWTSLCILRLVKVFSGTLISPSSQKQLRAKK